MKIPLLILKKKALNRRLSQIDEDEYKKRIGAMKKYVADHIWKTSDGQKSRIPENILREVIRVAIQHNDKVLNDKKWEILYTYKDKN